MARNIETAKFICYIIWRIYLCDTYVILFFMYSRFALYASCVKYILIYSTAMFCLKRILMKHRIHTIVSISELWRFAGALPNKCVYNSTNLGIFLYCFFGVISATMISAFSFAFSVIALSLANSMLDTNTFMSFADMSHVRKLVGKSDDGSFFCGATTGAFTL